MLEAERARIVAELRRIADAFEAATIQQVAEVLLRANAAVATLLRRLQPSAYDQSR
jgi:hypothetical protein